MGRLALAPCVFLRGGDGAEGGVERGALRVVGFEALAAVGAERILVQRVHVDWGADLVDGAQVCGGVSWGRDAATERRFVLLPRSRPVGVKTESTAEEGAVHPGGGSFFAAAHADTGEVC